MLSSLTHMVSADPPAERVTLAVLLILLRLSPQCGAAHHAHLLSHETQTAGRFRALHR